MVGVVVCVVDGEVVGVDEAVEVAVVVAVVVGVVTSHAANAPWTNDSAAKFNCLAASLHSVSESALMKSSNEQLSLTSTSPLENSAIILFSTSSVSVQLLVFVNAVVLAPLDGSISTPHSIAVLGPSHATDISLIRAV